MSRHIEASYQTALTSNTEAGRQRVSDVQVYAMVWALGAGVDAMKALSFSQYAAGIDSPRNVPCELARSFARFEKYTA